MKTYLTALSLLFSTLLVGQESIPSEELILLKADSYFNALEKFTSEGLSEEDKIYLNENDTLFHTYCLKKGYHYYTKLIENFPTSKDYTSYLFKKGLMSEGLFSVNEFKNLDQAKKSFKAVIDINNSSYYSKLSLYFLATIYVNENNCGAAKMYITQLNKVDSDLINEYQKEYIKDGVNRINRLCN